MPCLTHKCFRSLSKILSTQSHAFICTARDCNIKSAIFGGRYTGWKLISRTYTVQYTYITGFSMARKFKLTFMRSISMVCHLDQEELKPKKWKKLIHLPIVFSYETHSDQWGLCKLMFDSCPTSELLWIIQTLKNYIYIFLFNSSQIF